MAEKMTITTQTEHLHMKTVGTGHADITKLYASPSLPCYR